MSAGFIEELKRRNVIRTAIAYLVGAWVVIQAADILLPIFNAPDWVLRVIVMLLGLGLVITVIVSWAYEATDEGLRRDGEAVVSPERKRRMNVVIALMAIIGIGLSYWIYEGEITTATDDMRAVPADEPSIAVLPFVNMSGIEENEYFSDGLTETLLHMLAQVDGLKVAARTSAFAFKGRNEDVREIGRQLAVNHVLEGSVQRAGNRVRVTAQLIDASDGSHLWSENFDRDLDDIFAIQDEIATAVASRLKTELLAEDAISNVSTSSTEAYDLYLRALEQQAIFSYESLPKAETLLKAALVSDPDFHDARRELARNYSLQVTTGLMPAKEEVAARIRELLEAVVAGNQDDYLAAGMLWNFRAQRMSRNTEMDAIKEAASEVDRLVEQSPNEPLLRLEHSSVLVRANRIDDAIATLREGLAVDPLSAELNYRLGSLLRQMGRLDEARPLLERAVELNPDDPNIVSSFARLAISNDDMVGAIRNYLRAMKADPSDPELPAQTATMLFELDMLEAGNVFLAKAEAINPENALVRALQGRRAELAGDYARAYELSSQFLADRPPDRHNAWQINLQVFLRTAMRSGRQADALELIESTFPDALDYSQPVFDEFMGMLRLLSLGLYEDMEERQENIDVVTRAWDAQMPQWRNNPMNTLFMRGIEGDGQAAIDLLLPIEPGTTYSSRTKFLRVLDWPMADSLFEREVMQEWLAPMLAAQQEDAEAVTVFLQEKGILD